MVYSLVCPRSFCHVCYLKESTPTEIYTLSLHDALPILRTMLSLKLWLAVDWLCQSFDILYHTDRSEEHTSELQSRPHLVCRLLLEKKKKSVGDKWSTAWFVHGASVMQVNDRSKDGFIVL